MAGSADSNRLPCHQSVYDTLTDPMLDFSAPASPNGPNESVQEEQRKLPEPSSVTPAQTSAFFDSPVPPFDEAFRLSSSWQEINGELSESVKGNDPKLNATEFVSEQNVPEFSANVPEFSANVPEFSANVPEFSLISVPGKSAANSRPSSASILSNSTDDERAESMVIIPSFRTPSQILLFETDEEDEPERCGIKRRTLDFGDDASTLISNTGLSKSALFCDSSQPFIMPRLSFTESVDHFNLTIVSSSSALILQEANFLKQHIEGFEKSAHFSLKLSQVCLEKPGSETNPAAASDLQMASASDLVLIVNDGSLKIPELLKMLKECSAVPRFVVINLINSNYFINLLDIINICTPHKIFKTSSLTSGKVLHKIHDLITQEMTIYSHSKTSNAGRSEERCGDKCGEKSGCEKRKKRKYKQLEKSWVSEFGASSYHKSIDPLKITGVLNRLSVFGDVLENYIFNDMRVTNDKSWLMVSFAVGIGLGVTLNAVRILDWLKMALLSSRPKNKVFAKVVPRKNISALLAVHARLFQERVMAALKELLQVDMREIWDSFRTRTAISADLVESGLFTGSRIITSFISSNSY